MTDAPDGPRGDFTKVRVESLYSKAATRYESAGDIATLGLRSVLLANGGALVALLTFVGNAQNTVRAPELMWWAYSMFGLGLFAALLSTFCAFQTQSDYARQGDATADRIYFHTIGHIAQAETEEKEADRYRSAGQRWEWAGVSLFLISTVCFLVGTFFGLFALIG